MIYKVSVVENNIPPTTAIPIETLLCDPEPKAKAIGKIPNIVQSEVIMIGRKRATAASCTAFNFSDPDSLRWFANSTIKIPFLVTRPMSTMIPICEKIFSV